VTPERLAEIRARIPVTGDPSLHERDRIDLHAEVERLRSEAAALVARWEARLEILRRDYEDERAGATGDCVDELRALLEEP